MSAGPFEIIHFFILFQPNHPNHGDSNLRVARRNQLSDLAHNIGTLRIVDGPDDPDVEIVTIST
jgi:hypothetical protein